MLEFWKRRKYIQILWKNSAATLAAAGRTFDDDPFPRSTMEAEFVAEFAQSFSDSKRKKNMRLIMKLLSTDQLRELSELAAEKGAMFGQCLMVPGEVRSKPHSTSVLSTLLLTCQLWRWPDLESTKDLQRLPHVCQTHVSSHSSLRPSSSQSKTLPEIANHHDTQSEESSLECCNPFHYSRLMREPVLMDQKETSRLDLIISPPPSPCLDNDETVSVKEMTASASSTETGISRVCGGQHSYEESSSMSLEPHQLREFVSKKSSRSHHHWATAMYWEEKERIGVPFQIVQPDLSVFYCIPRPERGGMSLKVLENKMRSERIQKTRNSIGPGFVLFLDREQRQISIYNRSELSLFLWSSYLDARHKPKSSDGQWTYKLLPGYSIKAFDLDFTPARDSQVPFAPDPFSILVSFGKGWGVGYSRNSVTQCSCWVQIVLDNLSEESNKRRR